MPSHFCFSETCEIFGCDFESKQYLPHGYACKCGKLNSIYTNAILKCSNTCYSTSHTELTFPSHSQTGIRTCLTENSIGAELKITDRTRHRSEDVVTKPESSILGKRQTAMLTMF